MGQTFHPHAFRRLKKVGQGEKRLGNYIRKQGRGQSLY